MEYTVDNLHERSGLRDFAKMLLEAGDTIVLTVWDHGRKGGPITYFHYETSKGIGYAQADWLGAVSLSSVYKPCKEGNGAQYETNLTAAQAFELKDEAINYGISKFKTTPYRDFEEWHNSRTHHGCQIILISNAQRLLQN